MSTALSICLIILVCVLIIAAIVLTVYAVKFLIELCVLTRNLNETTTIIKREAEPVLSELSITLKHVNKLAANADSQMSNIRKIIATIIGAASFFTGKFKFLSSNFMKGFFSAFNFFKQK